MARDNNDSLVSVGGGWFWLSDVIGVVPPNHEYVEGLPCSKKDRGSVVMLESGSIPLWDEREPDKLIRDISGVEVNDGR